MRISKIFILSMLFIFMLAQLIIFLIVKYHSFRVLNETEIESLRRENARIISTIENELEQHIAYTRDWANWDDTYQFMNDRGKVYILSNFSQEMLRDMRALGMLFLDEDFAEFFSYGLEGENARFKQAMSKIVKEKELILKKLGNRNHQLIFYETTMGFFFSATIFATTPTHVTNEMNGYLILVMLIDGDFIKKISEISGHDIRFSFDENHHDFACSALSTDGRFCNGVYFPDDKTAILDISLFDVHGEQKINLHSEVGRALHQKIEQVFRNTMVVNLLVSIAGCVVILFLLHLLVVGPTAYLAASFSTIAREKALHERLKLTGPDEIRQVTEAANSMLDEISILNRKLEDLSNTDGLTQLSNRRFFQYMFEHEVSRAIREKQPLGLLMLDIDYFKKYNDTYGHIAGDACLQKVAAVIKESARRGTDIVARYGGEEFILMFCNMPVGYLEKVAEDICNGVRGISIPHVSSEVAEHVTCSIGGLSVIPAVSDNGESLLLRVDELLYQAKENGRNRVVVSDRLVV